MHRLITITTLALTSFTLQAADLWVGTWRLDPSRSHFENMGKDIKDMVLVITEEHGYHVLKMTTTLRDGKIEHPELKQPNNGGKLIPSGATQVRNGVLEVRDHEWIYRYYADDGKLLGTRYVNLSNDGQSQDAIMQGLNDDGKQALEHEVLVKQ